MISHDHFCLCSIVLRYQSKTNMVDIHSHVLWGLDDGSETYEESLAMLRGGGRGSTTDIVATPHANSRYTVRSATD